MENRLWRCFINRDNHTNILNYAQVIRTVAMTGTEISNTLEDPRNEVCFLVHAKVNGRGVTIVYDGDKYSCINCGWIEKLGWRLWGKASVKLSEPDFDICLEDKKLIDGAIVDYLGQESIL